MGFLGSVVAGPMEATFHSWAGDAWVDGSRSRSTNPCVDHHVVCAVALIALACAGDALGLGRLRARLPFVGRNRWLR